MSQTNSATKVFKAHFSKAELFALYKSTIAEGASVGRDGVRLKEFEKRLGQEIDLILRKVKARTYQFTSYKEKLVSKGAGKSPRQLSIPTVRDKLVLKSLARALAEIFPAQVAGLPHSTIKRVHEASRVRPATDFYLRLDIQHYYPSINHKILLKLLRRKIRNRQLIHLLTNAIQTPTGKKKSSASLNAKGVPQGLSISNILSAIYLTDVDDLLATHGGIDYFRYVDDILFAATPSEIEELEKSVPRLLRQKRKLECHKVGTGGKSVKVPLSEGIEYLGYRFCGNVIEVRASSLKKMFANLMKNVTGFKYKKQSSGKSIWRLNLRITGCQLKARRIGWLFFFSQSKNLKQLKHLDAFLAKQIAKVVQPEEIESIKRFVKAYHEIKFNLDKTKYIPNFDELTDDEKKEHIAILRPKKASTLDALSPAELDDLFQESISYEVDGLEKDMMEAFS